MDDDILAEMRAGNWPYGDGDPNALRELEKKIERAGREGRLLFYGELVEGVTFRLENVDNGRPFEIDFARNWALYSKIIGEFLGRISTRSYERACFVASALVVGSDTGVPSPRFFSWMREVGLLKERGEMAELTFWQDQVQRAHADYGA